MATNQKSWQKALILCSSIGTTLAALVIGGYFLGEYIDARFVTKPLFTLVLMIGGLLLGVSYLVIKLIEFGASDDKK